VTFWGVATVWRVFTRPVTDPFCAWCRHGESEMVMVLVLVLMEDVGSDNADFGWRWGDAA
jgi:hypothetical protein